jgi:hypothetical protein
MISDLIASTVVLIFCDIELGSCMDPKRVKARIAMSRSRSRTRVRFANGIEVVYEGLKRHWLEELGVWNIRVILRIINSGEMHLVSKT